MVGNILGLFWQEKRLKIGGGVGDGARYWSSFLVLWGILMK